MPTISKLFVDEIWDKNGINKIIDVQESWLYTEDYNFAGETGSVARLIVDTIEAPLSPVANGQHGAQGTYGGIIQFLNPISIGGAGTLEVDKIFTKQIFRDTSYSYAGIYLDNDANETIRFKNESNIDRVTLELETGTIYTAGNIFAEGDITSEYTSDERLKDIVSTLENSLDAIRNIEPIKYKWNELAEKEFNYNTNEIELGFKAQQIQKYFPELVTNRGNTDYLKMDYQKMTVVLLSALQELDKKVQELEKKLEEK